MNRAGRLFPFLVRGVRLIRGLRVGVLLGPLTGAAVHAQTAPLRPLSYTRFTLSNGLVAILHEDHATPIASVQVRYHVGSKDDKPNEPGTAHLCEHLMSQGSPHVNQAQPAFYRSIGGTSTSYAETTEDVTEFFITVPSNELETVLWAESDRMAAPLATVDSQRIAAVRAVVEQERRQRIDNVPFGTYRELTVGALFPPGHPYHLTPLSQPAAEQWTGGAGDARAVCASYYVPNNAVLAISGDFVAATARAMVEKYFGSIARGAPVAHADTRAVPLAREQRLVLEDSRANQPRLHLAWRGASYASPDRMALLAVASALALPRVGRLSKLLIDDRQLATTVTADDKDLEESGVFEIIATPRPGASMTRIEELIDSTLGSIASGPLTSEEVARFNAFNRVIAATSLQLEFARADTLAHDQAFIGDPTSYASQANAALDLTPADVQAAVRKYLSRGRVVLSLVPAGKLELVSKPNLPYTKVTPPGAVGRP
jgi:zinc protease